MFLSASVGFCALAAIIRGLRGDEHMGNFYVDMWRVADLHLRAGLRSSSGVLLMSAGHADDLRQSTEVATTLEPGAMGTDDKGQAKPQTIAGGPVAAVIPIKQLGTNGGGFFGANSAHPFENPNALDNFCHCARDHPVPVRARGHVRPDARTTCGMPPSSSA